MVHDTGMQVEGNYKSGLYEMRSECLRLSLRSHKLHFQNEESCMKPKETGVGQGPCYYQDEPWPIACSGYSVVVSTHELAIGQILMLWLSAG